MTSNVFAGALEQNHRPGEKERLPVRTAALSVFVLSLLSWAAVLVPVIALLHR
jgi:hypothetical protein